MTDTTRLDRCTSLLCDLIGYRTENPGGDELALCARLAEELEARGPDSVEVVEVPRQGRETGGYVFARYGQPRLLLNVHLDTVPANTGWTRDPFRAVIDDGKLYGLGSADTKGAIACALSVLREIRPHNVGILFSGDEERGMHCVSEFVASKRIDGIERAIVCEPTGRRIGVRHRGIHAYTARVAGRGGHSSKADFMPKPVVTMARLAVSLDELGRRYLDAGPDDMKGLCMNVASIDGGVAFNVIPDSAELSLSIRPAPGFDRAQFEREMYERASAIDPAIAFTTSISAAPFACRDVAWFERLIGERADSIGPLDFWTEAAIASASGIDAVVLGPGDIGHAHAPDEFVPLDDLQWAMALFAHALQNHESNDA